MNNGLAITKHIARTFGLGGEFKRGFDGNGYYNRNIVIYGYNRITLTNEQAINYIKLDMGDSHKPLMNTLSPIVRHYAQCYGISYHDNVIYVIHWPYYVTVWNFDGSVYTTLISLKPPAIKEYITNVSTNTLYIMKIQP